jgi:virulence factor Mce-like protein
VSRRRQGFTANPVLVGAVTLLVVVVGVFLSYNANSGLPFVPTYDVKADLPDAENLVAGNDVRIGGARVGVVSHIEPVPHAHGPATARVTLKLEKSLERLPLDTTVLVRPRSALGLKYVQLTPGRAAAGYQPGATIPLRNARPHPVELDQILNSFNAPTRLGAQGALNGLGNGLAGRGSDLNDAIGDLAPLLANLRPVARNLSDPRTRLSRLIRALGATAQELAPVADVQAALFVNLDTTFAALARVARPFLQETVSETPPTEAVAIADLPRQRPFLRNTAALLGELEPGAALLPSTAPALDSALASGTRVLPQTPPFNRQVASVFRALGELVRDPLATAGLQQLADTAASLRPTLAFLTPVQTTCNYVTLWFRNISSLLSEGDANGTWQRFIIIVTPLGPNNEGGPSSAPANGPGADNHLHSNPYPNTASPGQTRECAAGNETYRAGQTVIGNVPGNQGTKTDGQASTATAEARR